MREKKQKAQGSPSIPSPSHDSNNSRAMEAAIAAINSKLDHMCSKIDKLDSLENDLREARGEIAALRSELVQRDKKIADLTNQLNHLDQMSRSNTIRIVGLPVQSNTATNEVIDTTYNLLLKPILQGALNAGDIPDLPTSFHLIDTAFTIPSKNTSSATVIMKLANSRLRTAIFKHKKEFAPRGPVPHLNNKILPTYAIYEDLTKTNSAYLRNLIQDDRVSTAWSYGGQIRFRLHNSERILRVKSTGDTIDSLLN